MATANPSSVDFPIGNVLAAELVARGSMRQPYKARRLAATGRQRVVVEWLRAVVRCRERRGRRILFEKPLRFFVSPCESVISVFSVARDRRSGSPRTPDETPD